MARTRLAPLTCAAALTVVAAAPWAHAQDETWSFVPSIGTNLTWTDNIRLEPDADADEQTVIEVTPAFSLRRNSRRLETDFDYRLQSQFYDDSDLDKIVHLARLTGSAAIIENSLFLDFRARLTEQIIDPAEGIPLSTTSDSRNRTNVATYSVYPNWRGDLGNFAQATAGYRYGIVEYGETGVRDSKEREAIMQVSGNPTINGLGWALDYVDTTVEYDNGEELDLARASLTLTYPITPKTNVIVLGGVDDNDIGRSTSEDIDGSFWQVGLSGQLGRSSQFEVRAGDAFYGDSYYAMFGRQGRRLNVQLEYDEYVTTTGRSQLDYDAFLSFLADVSGTELDLTDTQVYVRKLLTVSSGFSLAKTSFDGRIYYETRDYNTDSVSVETDDGIFGFSVGTKWNVSDRTEARFDTTWRKFDLRSSSNEPEDTTLRLSAKHRLGGGFSVSGSLWYNRRSATIDVDEFTENAASIGINKSF